MNIEDYDTRRDRLLLRSIERDAYMADRQGLAHQAALSEHPVLRYVRTLPVDSPLYPAIEYLGLSPSQERPGFRKHEYIEWSMPARDKGRPSVKGCGFVRSKEGGGIVYTACPDDAEHHCKGKRFHCWSLRCPECVNDTALKKGISIERQLLVYSKLCSKQGLDPGDIGHWVVSPPQDLAMHMMQTRDEFDELSIYVEDSMRSHGATAGVSVFHPWRQGEDEWRLAPHFHILCYGRIDTTAFRKDNPGWVVKKIHPRDKIRSIRHTAAYLLTHMGLGISERDHSEVNWDLKLLDYMIPGLRSPGAGYTEKDYENMSAGRGRMVGDLSDVDWVEWTMDELTRELRIRYWGGAAVRNIRRLGNLRQYKVRVCRECGCLLRTYDGIGDRKGNHVRYIQDNPVFAFAGDVERVRVVYLQYKDRLRSEGLTIADFAAMVPLAVSTFELGLPGNADLVMDGPFEEPDAYFLRRQRQAFGADGMA